MIYKTQIRVYYEDTDFSGVVYHANYVKFFERGRTECLRDTGNSHSELMDGEGAAYVVRKMEIDFLKPAKIDDLLEVRSEVVKAKGARVQFHQEIWRGEELMVSAEVEAACVTKEGRPRRLPETMLNFV